MLFCSYYDFCTSLPSGRVHKAHQRWGLSLGQVRNPDRPHGRRNLEAFANLRRTVQYILSRVSSESVLSLRIDLRSSIVALHWAMKWIEVSSSSWQRGHTASFQWPIILRCRLRSAWLVSNPTRILKSFVSRQNEPDLCPVNSRIVYSFYTSLAIQIYAFFTYIPIVNMFKC